jgi:hypothetical protein
VGRVGPLRRREPSCLLTGGREPSQVRHRSVSGQGGGGHNPACGGDELRPPEPTDVDPDCLRPFASAIVEFEGTDGHR